MHSYNDWVSRNMKTTLPVQHQVARFDEWQKREHRDKKIRAIALLLLITVLSGGITTLLLIVS